MTAKLRLCIIIAFAFLALSSLIAQQRVLLRINKNRQQESIPIRKGERAEEVLSRLDKTSTNTYAIGTRDSIWNFGKNGATYFIASHQDVMFQWFNPQGDGMVLEFGWKNGTDVGTIPKSTIRAWQADKRLTSLPTNALSTIRTGSLGNMGYYKKSDDGDGLKTPFKDEATDTNFVGGLGDSTIRFDPLGKEAKWLLRGQQFSLVPGAWQSFKLLDFGDSMRFCSHQLFGFTKQNDTRISDLNGGAGDINQLIGANSADQYPYHSIKFYEDTPTSNYGWQIRDYEWNMYVIVMYTTSRPPKIEYTRLHTTLKTTPRKVSATIIFPQCDGLPYISSVDLFYKINSSAYIQSSMTGTIYDYIGTIPGANPGDTVSYYIVATFSDGWKLSTIVNTYYIFKPSKTVLYMWNGRSLPNGIVKLSDLAVYGMLRDSMKEKAYYDIWDVKLYGTDDIPTLLPYYKNVVEATGDRGYADLTKFAGPWLATGTPTNRKSWFWSDQDHGTVIGYEDTVFLDADPHAKYFGVKALINQDYPYTANGNASVTKSWQLDFVAKTDDIFGFIDAKMTNDTVTFWYDPYHEWPPFTNWMDEFTPTPSAKVLFKDKKNNTKVVGVRNTATDHSWYTVWLAFDYLSTDFRGDTSKSFGDDKKYARMIDVRNPAAIYPVAIPRVDQQPEATVPHRFSLSQNYPNPFNPMTNFRFSIADLRFVALKVFDLLGREVATLVNEEKPAGSYTVQWDATHFASGVYFYRLQAGAFSDTKKLLLLR